ncbi:MAG: VCBS repeat-containing protein [Desulfobacteraceae bacterium]|nr:VCBS repeat-containing protein [Desulfobacteraceae bacterium]
MFRKNFTKFILILFSILVIPIGTFVMVDSGIAQEGGKELLKPKVVYSQEKFVDPEHQELVELLKYYRKIGDRENAIKILEQLRPPVRETLYEPIKSHDVRFEEGEKEESEISTAFKWDTSDISVMAMSNHEKSPAIETRNFGSMTPDLYIAAEYWDGTTSTDNIRIRRSSNYGSAPNWWTGGYTIDINSSNPLSNPKIKQISDQDMGVVWVDEFDSADHDIVFARIDATDFTDNSVTFIDVSFDDNVSPAITSDYIDYPLGHYIYVVYYKLTGTTAQLLFSRSTDNGVNWSSPTVLEEFTEGHVYCSIDYTQGDLYVAYGLDGGSSDDIAVVKSSDLGVTWTDPTVIANDSTDNEWYPEITACTDEDVYIAYEYHASATDRDVYYAYTSDAGITWNTNNSLATSTSDERFPSIRAFKGGLEVYASYVKLPTEVILREAEYTNPTSWTSGLNVKKSAYNVSDADPVALLPKYSPNGDVGVGVAWAALVGGSYDIHFNADWLPCYPGAFSYLSPANGETDVSVDADLDWEDSSYADVYDVYFGTTSPPPHVDTVASSTYDPGTLSLATTYYWEIVAVNDCGGTQGQSGQTWEFTTPITAMPDLIVDSLTHSPLDPLITDLITFTAVVENVGNASSGSSSLELKIGGELSPLTYAVPSLDPGETHQIQRQETISSAGDYLITATADIYNDVAESEETNNDTTDVVSVNESYGSLIVTIEPQGAIDAGAQWKMLCSTIWNDSGFEESDLSEGNVIVEFKDIPGWLKPDDQIVSITAGDTAVVTGIYMQLSGTGVFVDSGQSLGNESSYGVKLGDLDGDGDLDAFISNYISQANKVWLNDGSGTFTDSGQSLGSGYSFCVALGDIDSDGDLDAFVANDGPNKVWLNDGVGTFTDSGQSLGSGYSKGARLGDVDCDGDFDAFVANHGEANKVWLNDGSGTFTDSGQSLGNSKSMELAFGDIDGDGDFDVFVANAGNEANKVWLNDGSGTFTDSGQSLASAWSLEVDLVDLDGDGDLDAFVANSATQANKVWLNDGSGTFTDSGQSLGSSTSIGMALGDMDGDGDLDAFIANASNQANKVWLNDGSGTFTDSGQSLGSSSSYGVALGRINGDDSLDAFVANYSSQANRVWLNVCLPPTIDTQPQSQTIDYNTTANLSATASSGSPVSYQWYQGDSGDTSTQVGTDSDSYTTPNLTETTSYWVRVSNACGSTDSDTAAVSVLPSTFTNYSPADISTAVALDIDLDWEDSTGATSYDVYLGITSPPPYAASVTESYYDPGGLGACETYYWKIVAKNDSGDIEGPEWSFSTISIPPGNFSYLSPSDFATDVPIDADLDWEDSTGAASYDVYFGTSDPPPHVNTVNESYYDPGVLDPNTTYHWSIFANNSCGNASPGGWSFTTGQKSWTFMVYLDADNNLEGAGIDDFLEMASVGSNSAINIVVQFDRIDGFDTSYGDWTTTKRFYITNGLIPDPGNEVEDLGELNHGDPQTLIDFVDWAKMNYPAERYALILWNHGGGWRESKEREEQAKLEGKDTPYYRAVCWDDTDGHDTLYTNEVQNALNSTGGAELIGFDACLMAMGEVAYEIRNYGEVMVGSEETEPGDGWPYDTILQDLANNPGWSSAELGQAVVDRYYESYGNDETQSAIDLSAMDSLASTISTFAQSLIDNWDSDEDAVRSAAQDVMTEVENAVIREQHGSGWPGAHGLAIYFPSNSGDFESDYNGTVIDFADDTQWDEFLQEFYSSMGGSWIADARAMTQDFAYPQYIDLYDFCYRLVHVPDTYYTETLIPNDFLGGGTAQGVHADDSTITYALPFDFPYFGETIPAGTNIYICTNGFVDLESYSTAYTNNVAQLIANKRIAAFWEDLVTNGSAQAGEDIYITEDPGYLAVRWLAETLSGDHPVNFELIMYTDGRYSVQL